MSFPLETINELATRQMRLENAPAGGGMISIVLESDLEGVRRFLEELKVFTLAESLGGVESLVNHPAIMTHASMETEARAALGITDTLVRLSVGIEDIADLQADLDLRIVSETGSTQFWLGHHAFMDEDSDAPDPEEDLRVENERLRREARESRALVDAAAAMAESGANVEPDGEAVGGSVVVEPENLEPFL